MRSRTSVSRFSLWSVAGCTMRTVSACRLRRRRRRQAIKAPAGMQRRDQHGDRQADAYMPARGKQRRRGEDENRKRVHAGHADDGDRLHELRDRHRRLADRAPREAGEGKGAQPFGQGESSRRAPLCGRCRRSRRGAPARRQNRRRRRGAPAGPSTPIGIAEAYSSASTSMALPIHQRPATK